MSGRAPPPRERSAAGRDAGDPSIRPPGSKPPPTRVTVDAENAGRRLDGFVRQLLPTEPRAALMKWIRRGMIRVNGRRADLDVRLADGDVVSVPGGLTLAGAAPEPARARPTLPAPDVLYEDDDVLVVDKPAGLAAHPGTGHEHDSLIDRVLAYLGAATAAPGHRPGLVQRLDEGVSGVLVVGKNARALRHLNAQVASDHLDKRYVALVAGTLEADGVIDLPLAQDDVPDRDRPHARVDAAGQRARTDYHVERRYAGATLVEVRIHTGRQHQIRAHLAAVGHPIAGDRRYGTRASAAVSPGLERPFLHARSVTFEHPVDGRSMRVEAPLPGELAAVLARLRR